METMRAYALGMLVTSLLVPSCTRRDGPATDAPSLVPTAAAATAALPVVKETAAPATERLVGRFVREPGGMRFAWPGSAIVARFQGTGISMRLKDDGYNLFQVVVDGETKKVLRTDKTKDLYALAEGLPDGVHELVVEKRTEAKVGEAVFVGLQPAAGGKLLAPPPARPRHIELVGDSITTGYGNEGPSATCGFVNSQQNEYLTYGAIAARALDADHTTIAWSGKTLHEMTVYFDRVLPAREDSKWDFSLQPQVVVLNVGTNNFARVDPGEARFVTLYHALVQKVRSAYPKAFIVCALGPMLSDVYPENRRSLTQARKYMRVAVAKLKEAGDANLDMLEFPEQNHADGLGCGFHPSLKTHRLMSDRLVAMLKERLGW